VTDDGAGADNGTASTNTSNLSVTGKINNGFEFVSASSEYVDLNAWEAATGSDTSGTIAMWVKVDNTASRHYIWSRSIAAANTLMRLGTSTLGRFRFLAQVGGADQINIYSSDNQVPNNEWFHVCLVQNGTSPKLYINGVEDTNSLTGADPTYWFADTAHDRARLGCVDYNTGGNQGFTDCEIDDFRYYSGTFSVGGGALTEAQVWTLYNEGRGTEEWSEFSTPTEVLEGPDTITEPTQEYFQDPAPSVGTSQIIMTP
jgi:hypothetical protein